MAAGPPAESHGQDAHSNRQFSAHIRSALFGSRTKARKEAGRVRIRLLGNSIHDLPWLASPRQKASSFQSVTTVAYPIQESQANSDEGSGVIWNQILLDTLVIPAKAGIHSRR